MMEMVDAGERDTKLLAVPASSKIKDLSQVSLKTQNRLRSWFNTYKDYEGKAPGTVQVGRFLSRTAAMAELNDNRAAWKAKFGAKPAQQSQQSRR
jgi:inorganic pyrophosphatase